MRRAVNHPIWLTDLGPTPTGSLRAAVEDWRGRAWVIVSPAPAPGIVCDSCDSTPTQRHCMHACWLLLRIGGQLDSAVFGSATGDRAEAAVRATHGNLRALVAWTAAVRAGGGGSMYAAGHPSGRASVARVAGDGELVETVVCFSGADLQPHRWSPGDPGHACPICLEPFGTAECTACGGCRNGFHAACVGRWGVSCPTCRSPHQFAVLNRALDADLAEFVEGFRGQLAGGGPVPSPKDALREIVAWL